MTTDRLDARSQEVTYFSIALLAMGVAAAAAVVAVLALRSHPARQAVVPERGPALVTQAQLARLAASVGHPVYWAGPKQGFSYELTRLADGRIYIRYLQQGVAAGDPRPSFLVIGTYPRAGSYADLSRAARRTGAISLPLAKDGLVVINAARSTSVYFAYRHVDYQVEVYSPSADTARRLVLGGSITPIS
jgi:hypothetical protein